MEEDYSRKRMIRWLELTARSRAPSLRALEDEIIEYLEFLCVDSRGETLLSLNRRYGMKAVEFGTSVRNVLQHLYATKRIELYRRRNSFVVFSVNIEKEINLLYPDIMDPRRVEYLNSLIEAAAQVR